MRISIYFKWFDFWIGWYYDYKNYILYIGILPMVGIKILFPLKYFLPHFLIYSSYLKDEPIGCCVDPSEISSGEYVVKSKRKNCPICEGRIYDERLQMYIKS